MLRKIGRVIIHVDNIEVAASYYARVFGLQLCWRESGSTGLTFPEADIEIVLNNKPGIPSSVEVCYQVDNVIASVARAAAQGCHILVAPVNIPTGKYAVIADPFGTQLSLIDTTRRRRGLMRMEPGGTDGVN